MARPEEMAAAMVANMKEKTGKDLAAWKKLVAKSGCEKHGEIVKWLKAEHGMTHGYANLVSHKFRASDAESVAATTDLVAAQYGGKKEGLRPIYDKLAKAIAKFGGDVELSPKKAYVSLRRSKQFGLIQPSTQTRVDLGINLKGEPASGRLEASGSFNAMVSHRVRLSAPADVDAEVLGWLREAYERA